MIDTHIGQRVLRHLRMLGFARILDNRDAAALFDRPQTGATIVQSAGKNDADDARAVLQSGRAKQWVDGRPGEVFARTVSRQDLLAGNDQMAVRWRDINPAAAD